MCATLAWGGSPSSATVAYASYATTGAYFTKGGGCGVALQAITDSSIKLIKVRLGSGSGGGGGGSAGTNRGLWSSAITYNLNDLVLVQGGPAAGGYISTIGSNTNDPATGIGWMQWPQTQAVGAWT